MREQLDSTTDYFLLPTEGYDALHSWYSGGPKIVRSAIGMGRNGSEAVVEVYPLKLRVVRAPGEPPVATLSLSKLATLRELVKTVVDSLGLGEHNPNHLRVYNYFGGMAQEDLAHPGPAGLDLEDSLDKACLVYNQELLVQIRIPLGGGRVDGAVESGEESSSSPELILDSDDSDDDYVGASAWNYSRMGYSRIGGMGGRGGSGGVTDPSAIPGVCGLNNLGNTCFMNSGLQCISHTPALVEYILAGKHLPEINRDNPLGMDGRIAEAYSKLLAQMWAGKYRSVAPRDFKYTIGQFAPRFVGFGQQDSQELIAFLLDGLHEDLNRILDKPLVPTVEGGERPDIEVAAEAWVGHRKRNDSVVVDLFQGQLKSRVVCPIESCGKVSITFDPFMYLSVPVPDGGPRTLSIRVVRADPTLPHLMANIFVEALDTVKVLKRKLAALIAIPVTSIVLTEVYEHKFYKWFDNEREAVAEILDEDVIVAYEIPADMLALPAFNPATNQLEGDEVPGEEGDGGEGGEEGGEEGPAEEGPGPLDSSASGGEDSDDDSDDSDDGGEGGEGGWWEKRDSAKCPFLVLPFNHYKVSKRRYTAAYTSNYMRLRGYGTRAATTVTTAFGVPTLVFIKRPLEGGMKDVEAALMEAMQRYVRAPDAEILGQAGIHPDPEVRASLKAKKRAEAKAKRVAARKLAAETRKKAREEKKVRLADQKARRAKRKEEAKAKAKAEADAAGEDAESVLDSSEDGSFSSTTISTLTSSSSSAGSTEVDEDGSNSDDSSSASSDVLGVDAERPEVLFEMGADGRGPRLASVLARRTRVGKASFAVTWNSKLVSLCYDESVALDAEEVSMEASVAEDSLPTLDGCLSKFTSEEELGEDDLWYCPSCQTFRQATKKFDVYSLPDVLVIHLKRFRQSRFSREKLDVHIDFPLEGLDMAAYVPEDALAACQAAGKSTVYDLYAVSDHFGGLGGGHYTAHAKNHRTGEWFYFNDSSAGSVRGDDDGVVTSAAYLLFYQRRGAPLHIPNNPPVRELVPGGVESGGDGEGGEEGGRVGDRVPDAFAVFDADEDMVDVDQGVLDDAFFRV